MTGNCQVCGSAFTLDGGTMVPWHYGQDSLTRSIILGCLGSFLTPADGGG